MNSAELKEQVRGVLQHNDRGDFTTPSPEQYPHQWNWDAAVIALGWSHFNMRRARTEIRSLLRAQWRDGMVPHIIYHQGDSDYFPPPDFWRTRDVLHRGAVESSALTQPPLLTTVVRALHERANDEAEAFAFLREVFPKLFAWHRWLHRARDADGSGLPCLIHPWESGTDNSPRWTAVLDHITPQALPAFHRRDTVHVSVDERPRAEDYDRFVFLIDQGRRMGWESARLLSSSPFLVQDVMFCSILHRADQDLLALAQLLGEATSEIIEWLTKTRQAFDARFWDDVHSLYLDYDVRAGAPIDVNTCATFMPLFAKLASEEQVAHLIGEHWNNPAEYAPGTDSKFRMPTTSKHEPGYAPRRYWCGPVWIIANWLVYLGLKQYGFVELAEELRQDSLELLVSQGMREYYDPRDGTGLGATQFSWSAALTFELLENRAI
jgi:mannosylglycerate hydrolase